jgi:hypothetical protein
LFYWWCYGWGLGGFINGVMDEFSMVYWWGYEWGLGHFMSGFIGGFLVMIFHLVWVLNAKFSVLCCLKWWCYG